MRLYAITERFSLPGPHRSGFLSRDEHSALLQLALGWAQGGVQWVQLREKDLPADALSALAVDLAAVLRGASTQLLLNGPAEIAARTGAAGVHLPGGWTAERIHHARALYADGGRVARISVACHSISEAQTAKEAAADLLLFAPVFGKAQPAPKPPLPGQGLAALSAFCRAAAPLPVFALGGIDETNVTDCLRAGAHGIAAIRLFLGDRWRPLAQLE